MAMLLLFKLKHEPSNMLKMLQMVHREPQQLTVSFSKSNLYVYILNGEGNEKVTLLATYTDDSQSTPNTQALLLRATYLLATSRR